MSRTFKDRSKRKHRKGQLCPRCLKSHLEFCECGCQASKNNNVNCKRCGWSNF